MAILMADVGIVPLVFEQPVDRDDWKGLQEVSNVARMHGIPVAVDESCRSLTDVCKIIDENLVDAINIKLPKFGVLGALEIINLARKSGLILMVDSMAETRLGTGFAGHLAAGVGCFKYFFTTFFITIWFKPLQRVTTFSISWFR